MFSHLSRCCVWCVVLTMMCLAMMGCKKDKPAETEGTAPPDTAKPIASEAASPAPAQPATPAPAEAAEMDDEATDEPEVDEPADEEAEEEADEGTESDGMPEEEPEAETEVPEIEVDAASMIPVKAMLASADALDGSVDQVVTRCASCALSMDGKPEHALKVAGYKMLFCSGHCQEMFSKDAAKNILALKMPE